MQKDEKKVEKTRDVEWTLIIANINDYDTITLDPPHWQFTAKVDYVRGDSAARWVELSGHGGNPREPVPAGSAGATGTIEFPLTFAMDTTACTMQAELKDAAVGGMTLVNATPRQWVDFVGPGMGGMGAARGGPAEWKSEVAAASRTTAGGNAISAGLYRGKFRQFDKLFRACARVFVQGEPIVAAAKKDPPCPPCRPLKLEYDLPADVSWHKIGNKYQPFWSFCTLSPLAAAPRFRTIMRLVLLNSDGKLEQITTHPY